jgi:hypothetical protein
MEKTDPENDPFYLNSSISQSTNKHWDSSLPSAFAFFFNPQRDAMALQPSLQATRSGELEVFQSPAGCNGPSATG